MHVFTKAHGSFTVMVDHYPTQEEIGSIADVALARFSDSAAHITHVRMGSVYGFDGKPEFEVTASWEWKAE